MEEHCVHLLRERGGEILLIKMASAISVSRGILTIILSVVFLLSATMKFTPLLDPETHKLMKSEFVHFAKVHPFTILFDVKIEPDTFRLQVAVWEAISALLLLLVSGLVNTLASISLMIAMAGAVYSHLAVGHDVRQALPAVVILALLSLRLLLSSIQEPEKEKAE